MISMKRYTDSMHSGWPLKEETGSHLKHQFLRREIEHFNVERTAMKKSKSKMNTPENVAMSWRCLLSLDSFHGWGNIFLHYGKKENQTHPCQLMAMAALTQGYWRVSLDKQLTEREWRRPLTWLDRFRDAVLLPASWGDENIQPHVGNKYLKIDFF